MDQNCIIKAKYSKGDYVFLLTSYMLGAVRGVNLGKPGYSHEFVAKLFKPILEKWGIVLEIRESQHELQKTVQESINNGLKPVHLSIMPYQDTVLAKGALNIVVPAWEFPDVPDYPFDGNPQNDWVRTCDQTDLCIVSGPFTRNAMAKSGTKTPIAIVPTPVPQGYFELPMWNSKQTVEIDTWAFDFPARERSENSQVNCNNFHNGFSSEKSSSRRKAIYRLKMMIRRLHKIPAYRSTSNFVWDNLIYRKSRNRTCPKGLPFPKIEKLALRGVVYTSIFNPYDGRKNWKDLLNGFLLSIGQQEDVTLVLKLASTDIREIRKIINYYIDRDLPHKCRIVFISAFLDDAQLLQLCGASTFYIHTTKAEGSCLPLMNYLAAGRPAVSPKHSCLEDYFHPEHGFVIASEQEPAAWPQEKKQPFRTTWARISWDSLREAIQESYRVAKNPEGYSSMATKCRDDMREWASYESVKKKLKEALKNVIVL